MSEPHSQESWEKAKIKEALRMLEEHIDVNPLKCGGRPTLKDRRFKVAQLLAEIADGDRNVKEIAHDFSLDLNVIQDVLHGMALLLDQSFTID